MYFINFISHKLDRDTYSIVGFIVSYFSLKETYITRHRGYGFAMTGLICNTLAIILPLLITLVFFQHFLHHLQLIFVICNNFDLTKSLYYQSCYIIHSNFFL